MSVTLEAAPDTSTRSTSLLGCCSSGRSCSETLTNVADVAEAERTTLSTDLLFRTGTGTSASASGTGARWPREEVADARRVDSPDTRGGVPAALLTLEPPDPLEPLDVAPRLARLLAADADGESRRRPSPAPASLEPGVVRLALLRAAEAEGDGEARRRPSPTLNSLDPTVTRLALLLGASAGGPSLSGAGAPGGAAGVTTPEAGPCDTGPLGAMLEGA